MTLLTGTDLLDLAPVIVHSHEIVVTATPVNFPKLKRLEFMHKLKKLRIHSMLHAKTPIMHAKTEEAQI